MSDKRGQLLKNIESQLMKDLKANDDDENSFEFLDKPESAPRRLSSSFKNDREQI